jgi:hypothetical protein
MLPFPETVCPSEVEGPCPFHRERPQQKTRYDERGHSRGPISMRSFCICAALSLGQAGPSTPARPNAWVKPPATLASAQDDGTSKDGAFREVSIIKRPRAYVRGYEAVAVDRRATGSVAFADPVRGRDQFSSPAPGGRGLPLPHAFSGAAICLRQAPRAGGGFRPRRVRWCRRSCA